MTGRAMELPYLTFHSSRLAGGGHPLPLRVMMDLAQAAAQQYVSAYEAAGRTSKRAQDEPDLCLRIKSYGRAYS